MKKIAYIIGHRSSEKYRTINLITTIKWLCNLKIKCLRDNIHLSIIVIEQDSKPIVNIDLINNNLINYINYKFLYNDGFYNRGWGFNVGFRLFSEYDYFFFADNDIIIDTDDMLYVFLNCFNYNAVNPYTNIYDSKENILVDEGIDLCKNFNIEQLKSQGKIQGKRLHTCFSGGIMGISQSSMYNVSGWDERFRGRGWEDYAFTSKIFLFLTTFRIFCFDGLHLWHPWEINTTRDINFDLNKEYETYFVDNYIDLINKNSFNFGLYSKYSTPSVKIKCNIKCYQIKDPLSKDQIDSANEIFNNLMKMVKYKHPYCRNKFYIRFIYYNLCEQHNCEDHKRGEGYSQSFHVESGDLICYSYKP